MLTYVITFPKQHVPGDLGELRVRERERPQPQVGGGVGDAAEHVLDRVYTLHSTQSTVNTYSHHHSLFVILIFY